jgi:hypothetical protein
MDRSSRPGLEGCIYRFYAAIFDFRVMDRASAAI